MEELLLAEAPAYREEVLVVEEVQMLLLVEAEEHQTHLLVPTALLLEQEPFEERTVLEVVPGQRESH